jgi:hypothetical protein
MVKYELTDFIFSGFKLIPDFDPSYVVFITFRKYAQDYSFVLSNDYFYVKVDKIEAQNIIQYLDREEIRIILEAISVFDNWATRRKYLKLFQNQNFYKIVAEKERIAESLAKGIYNKIMSEYLNEKLKNTYLNILEKLEVLNPKVSVYRKKVEEIDVVEFNRRKEFSKLAKRIGRNGNGKTNV